MRDVPMLGPLYDGLIGGHNLIVYAALVVVPVTHWIVARTRFGLRLRAVGENPQTVDAAGISVAWLRYRAVLLCGLLSGIAGTYLGIAQNAGFSRDMTAGQGYIALAALIFGKWRLYGALGACLMFGLLDAVAIRLQGVHVIGIGEVPVQLIQALPYLLTVILLAGFIGKAESGDKLTRFGPFSAQCRAGNVKILRGPWNDDLFRVLEGFPELAHDDEVDACSGALEMLNPNMKGWGIYELYRQQAERLRAEREARGEVAQSVQPTWAPGSMEWQAEQEKLKAEQEKLKGGGSCG